MRILLIADLHGRYKKVSKIKEEIERADVVVIAGDITNFGGKDEARNILREFMEHNPVVLAVQGNCDTREVNEALKEFKIWLHGRSIVYNGVGFFGVGGSNSTPFSTPQEYPEEKLVEVAERGYNSLFEEERRIFITHPPVYGILDKTSSGHRTGSKALRDFVRQNDIEFVVSAHIHEAKGIEEWQGKVFVNPGPFHMGYAIVELDREVKPKLVSL